MTQSNIGQYISYEEIDGGKGASTQFSATSFDYLDDEPLKNEAVELGRTLLSTYDYSSSEVLTCVELFLRDKKGLFNRGDKEIRQFSTYIEEDSTVLPYLLGAGVVEVAKSERTSSVTYINTYKDALIGSKKKLDHAGMRKKVKVDSPNLQITKIIYAFFSKLLLYGKARWDKRMKEIVMNISRLETEDIGAVPPFISPTGSEVTKVLNDSFYGGGGEDFALLESFRKNVHIHGVTSAVWLLINSGLLLKQTASKLGQDDIFEQIATMLRAQGAGVDQMIQQYGQTHSSPDLALFYAAEKGTYELTCVYTQHKGGVFDIPVFHTKLTHRLLPSLGEGEDQVGTVLFDTMYGLVKARERWKTTYVQELGTMENHQQERKKTSLQMNSLLHAQWNVDADELNQKDMSQVLAHILQGDDIHESDHLRDIVLLWYVIKKELGNASSPHPEQRRMISLPAEESTPELYHDMFACWLSAQPGTVEHEHTGVWSLRLGDSHTCLIQQDGNSVKISLFRYDITQRDTNIPLMNLEVFFASGQREGILLQSSLSPFRKEQQMVLSEGIEVSEGEDTGGISENGGVNRVLGKSFVSGDENRYASYVQGRQFLTFMQALSSASRHEDILALCKFLHIPPEGDRKKKHPEETFPLLCPSHKKSLEDAERYAAQTSYLVEKAIGEVYKAGSIAKLFSPEHITYFLFPYISRTQAAAIMDSLRSEKGSAMRDQISSLASTFVDEGKTNFPEYLSLIETVRATLEKGCRASLLSRALEMKRICASKRIRKSVPKHFTNIAHDLEEIQKQVKDVIDDESKLDLAAVYASFLEIKRKTVTFGMGTGHTNNTTKGRIKSNKNAQERQSFYKDQFKELSDQQEEIMITIEETLTLFQKTNYFFDKEQPINDHYYNHDQLVENLNSLVVSLAENLNCPQVAIEVSTELVGLIAGCEEKRWKPRDIKLKIEQKVALIFRKAIYDKLLSLEKSIHTNELFKSLRTITRKRSYESQDKIRGLQHDNRTKIQSLNKEKKKFKVEISEQLGLFSLKDMKHTLNSRIIKRLKNLLDKKTTLSKSIDKLSPKKDSEELVDSDLLPKFSAQLAYFRDCKEIIKAYDVYLESLEFIFSAFLEEVEKELGKKIFFSLSTLDNAKNICAENLIKIAQYREILSKEKDILTGYILKCNKLERVIRATEFKYTVRTINKNKVIKRLSSKDKQLYDENIADLEGQAKEVLNACVYDFSYGKLIITESSDLFDSTQPLLSVFEDCLSLLQGRQDKTEAEIETITHDEFYAREQQLRANENDAADDVAEMRSLERQLSQLSFDEKFIEALLSQLNVSIQINEKPLKNHPDIIPDIALDPVAIMEKGEKLTELLQLVQEYKNYSMLHKSEQKKALEQEITKNIVNRYLFNLAGKTEKKHIDACLQVLGSVLYFQSKGEIDKINQQDDAEVWFMLYQSDLITPFLQEISSEEKKWELFGKLMEVERFEGEKKIDSFLTFPTVKDGKANMNRFLELLENCGLISYVFEKKQDQRVEELFKKFPKLFEMIQKYIEVYSKEVHQKKVTDFLHAKIE